MLRIADAHCDTLYRIAIDHTAQQDCVVTPERMRKGGISLQTLALWTGTKGNKGDVAGIVEKELAALPKLTDAGIRRVDAPREALESGEPCCMLSVEGGEVFEPGLATVAEYRAKGVRMAALLWNNENAIGYPAKSGDSRGLTAYGLAVAREMQRLGMAVDTSHLNEAGFWDLINRTDVPPLASHSCCRALCDHFRNLTDAQIRALIAGGGYIGVNFYPSFLSADGRADAARVAEHIDHICQLGGAAIVGFGSDFDGIETTPSDIRNAEEVPNLLQALRDRGYSEQDIEGIVGMNLVRYFDRIA